MKRILTKEKVGGSFVIDSIQRVESSSDLVLFFVECKDWKSQHLVSFVKADNGYFIKDLTLGKQTKVGHKWSDLRTLTDYFNDIDIAEQNFEKGYGKKI